MIAVSYSTRVFPMVLSTLFLLIVFSGSVVQAQDRIDASQAIDRKAPVELSEEARARISASIADRRQAKQDRGFAVNKSQTEVQILAAVRNRLSLNAADVTYAGTYFDVQAGNDYSFTEDAHDFCRATFDAPASVDIADIELDMILQDTEALTVQLNWTPPLTGFTDYDLYLFDLNGFPVGDPQGLLDGSNGIDFQTDNTNPTETAVVTNNSGAEQPVLLIVDRFRGETGSDLSITVTGSDTPGAFDVLQYVDGDSFAYINAVADVIVGPLTEGLAINLSQLDPTRPNFNVELITDGCAESYTFSLVDAGGNVVQEFTDDDAPYALYGDDGNGDYEEGDLADGTYTLTATPYSEDGGANGTGVSGTAQSVTFSITSDPATAPTVDNFTLINAATDESVPGFDPITDGAVIDLIELFNSGITRDVLENQLNIRANVTDPNGQIETVDTDLAITLVTGDVQPVTNSDNGADYSVYGDDNAGDFADAALPLGDYALSGAPVLEGTPLASATVNFSIVGARIINYTLINADSDDPIDGTNGQPDFDPIPEGATIDVTTLGTSNVNIRANVLDFVPQSIESVRFEFFDGNGVLVKNPNNESFRPYALYGDPTNMDLDPPFDGTGDPKPQYEPWVAVNGDYLLNGTPYTGNNAEGIQLATLSLTFTIENGAAGVFNGPLDEPTLLPNYPNPFNPVTTLSFLLPERSDVRLTVYDMLGREVKVLIDGSLPGGLHQASFEAANLASGMYLYRLETPAGVHVRPMTLLK